MAHTYLDVFTMPSVEPATEIMTHFGDAPGGIIRAPKVWQADIALAKTTKLTEKENLEFRDEAFNIFNRTPLGDPGQSDILAGPPTPPNGPGLFRGLV